LHPLIFAGLSEHLQKQKRGFIYLCISGQKYFAAIYPYLHPQK
jgi:hypothetical protein